MSPSAKNINLNDFRKFLEYKGLKKIRTRAGHEIWSKKELLRPVILQTHINPIPEFIIRNNLRTIGSSTKELLQYLNRQ